MKSKIDLFVLCFAIVMLIISCASFKNNEHSEAITSVIENACEIACSQQSKIDKESCYKLCEITDDITSVVKKEWNIKLEKK